MRTASTFSSSQRGIEGLAGDDLADTTVHLECPDGRHDDGRVGRQPRCSALDVEELLGTHVGAEAGLGADDLRRRERQTIRDDRVVAVGDVRERAAMDEGRATFEGLEQVRLDRVCEQRRHRAGNPQILGGDGGPSRRVARTIRPRRARRSCRSWARARTAITSDATVMTNSVSRGTPFSRPPRPMITRLSARSLMSTTRGQRIANGSMPSALPW